MNRLARAALRRERVLVAGGLLLVVVASWAWLVAGAGMMQPMGDMLMPMSSGPWSAAHALLVFAMWVVMMAAMMLPGAAPLILLHADAARRRGQPGDLPAWLVLGYLAVWGGFGAAATALQWLLERLALLSPMMEASSIALAGGVLVAAGVYQWTPAKRSCLTHCRSPLAFVMAHWRDGRAGAFAMGARHGLYCLGCCAPLMALLFVGGVMNLAWIAGIAAFVAVEKFVPAGHAVGRAAGALLVVWGLATLWRALG